MVSAQNALNISELQKYILCPNINREHIAHADKI